MFFTSFTFIAFSAVLLLLYYTLPKKVQPYLLLLFSIAFIVSYSPLNLIFISATAVSTWGAAILIGRVYKNGEEYLSAHRDEMSRDERRERRASDKRKAKRLMIICLLFNLGMLAVLKYSGFVLKNVNAIFSFADGDSDIFRTIMLPIGISYYTFMCVGYIVDVYRGKYQPDKNLLHVALYTSYFPQLVQGPFSRYNELGAELSVPHGFDGSAFSESMLRVAWGYFKKLVLADRVAIVLKVLFQNPDEYQGAYVFAAVILYSIRIYGDFTGGIDITIGLSEALGIKLKENFVRPYFSKSIAEYWRRWHITLGEWFREYLFYPLSIAKPVGKLTKKVKAHLGAGFAKRVPVYTATIITWFVTGIWHGAAWNFIAWGMTNCIVILISQELSPLYERFHKKTGVGEDGAYGWFMRLRTYLLMGVIRMFDCYPSVGATLIAVGSMFTTFNPQVLFDGSMTNLTVFNKYGEASSTVVFGIQEYAVLLIGCTVIFIVGVLGEKKSVLERLSSRPRLRIALTIALVLTTLVFGTYGIGFDSSSFIYTQF